MYINRELSSPAHVSENASPEHFGAVFRVSKYELGAVGACGGWEKPTRPTTTTTERHSTLQTLKEKDSRVPLRPKEENSGHRTRKVKNKIHVQAISKRSNSKEQKM